MDRVKQTVMALEAYSGLYDILIESNEKVNRSFV